MRCHWIYVLLASLAIAVLSCGCWSVDEYGFEEKDTAFKRTAWLHLVSSDGSLLGYLEKCSSTSGGSISFVYDTRLQKVGFITPRGLACRYTAKGKYKEVGLFPEGGAESVILGVKGPVRILKRRRVPKKDMKPSIAPR